MDDSIFENGNTQRDKSWRGGQWDAAVTLKNESDLHVHCPFTYPSAMV